MAALQQWRQTAAKANALPPRLATGRRRSSDGLLAPPESRPSRGPGVVHLGSHVGCYSVFTSALFGSPASHVHVGQGHDAPGLHDDSPTALTGFTGVSSLFGT